jgi:hypothetical protein
METVMPNNKTTKNQDDELDEYDEITDEDYGFVIGPDGELKSLFLPVEYTGEMPDSVRKIFKILGISDLDDVAGTATRH